MCFSLDASRQHRLGEVQSRLLELTDCSVEAISNVLAAPTYVSPRCISTTFEGALVK